MPELQMNEEQVFQAYANTKKQMAELETILSALGEQVMRYLEEKKTWRVENDYGMFLRKERTSWKYTENVQSAIENINRMKKQEETSGTAEKKVTEYLMFKAS